MYLNKLSVALKPSKCTVSYYRLKKQLHTNATYKHINYNSMQTSGCRDLRFLRHVYSGFYSNTYLNTKKAQVNIYKILYTFMHTVYTFGCNSRAVAMRKWSSVNDCLLHDSVSVQQFQALKTNLHFIVNVYS